MPYITPNEHEAEILFQGMSPAEALRKYPNKLFITEGSKGVRYFDGAEEILVPTYKVEAVDTTGAGDTFNAAPVALAEGKPLQESIRFANRAASLSVTKFGAQGGMPTRRSGGEFIMKRNGILNSHISKILSDLGHTDMIAIADAGLPFRKECSRLMWL